MLNKMSSHAIQHSRHTTVKQREDRRVFQKYLTKLLYNNTRIPINNICDELSRDIWQFIAENVFVHFLKTHTPSFLRRLGTKEMQNQYVWETYCRFYLKGNKATLKWIRDQVAIHDKNKDSMYRVLLEVIYKSVLHHEADSDFDFSLVIHPDQVDYETDGRVIHWLLIECMTQCKEKLSDLFVGRYIDEFVQTANSFFTQQRLGLLKSLQDVDESFLDEIQKQELDQCISKLTSGQALTFSFVGAKESHIDFDKPIDTGTDQFLLYRLFLQCECAEAPNLFRLKQFAECVDISISLNGVYNLELWGHSSLDDMEVPVHLLHEEAELDGEDDLHGTRWDYPIVSLQYQLNDAIAMFAEDTPTKPEKRCERFIDQMRIFCVREQKPNLPDEITVSEPVFRTIMDPNSSCYDLNQVFSVHQILPSGFVKMNPKPHLQTLEHFEGWCRNQRFRNTQYPVGFYSMCNRPFISKNKLILEIRDMFGVYSITSDAVKWQELFNKPKQTLCIFYKEASFVLKLCTIFVGFMKKKGLALFAFKKDLKRLQVVSDELFNVIQTELPNANVENNVYSDLIMDFVGDSEEYLDRFDELVKQLVREYLRRLIRFEILSESLFTFISIRIPNNNFKQMLLNSTVDM